LEQLRDLGVVHITQKAAGLIEDDADLQAALQHEDELRRLLKQGAPDQLIAERNEVNERIAAALEAAKQAAKLGVQVNVIGVGSTTGAPIPVDGGYLTDDEGNPVTTYLNEKMAQEIADAGKGVYISGTAADAVSTLQETLDKLSKSDLAAVTYTQHDEQFPVFATIALLLLLGLLLLLERKNPWLKKYNFFTKEKKEDTIKNEENNHDNKDAKRQ
jgi:hypothetical protein